MQRKKITCFLCNTNSRGNTRSRSGGMLIVVLVIMALAVILITSALTIAVAGRHHTYKEAEKQQAGLTAMSCAKLIGDAAAAGDISIADLESLAAAGSTVELSSTAIPGLAGTAKSNTTAVFGYAMKNGIKCISATVTSIIDAEVTGTASSEQVTVLLEKDIVESKSFGNLITLGVDASSGKLPTENFLGKLAYGNASGTNSGGVVVHGDIDFSDSGSSTFYCDAIITNQLSLAKGADFYGNVIFFGDNASMNADSSGHGITQKDAAANIFFFRETRDSVFTDSSGNRIASVATKVKADGGVYLYNSNFVDSQAAIGKGILVGSNSAASPSPAYTGTLTQDAADALYENIRASVSRKLLVYPQAELLALFPTTSITVITSKTPVTNSGATISVPGAYYINTSTTGTISKNLTFDLKNGSIDLYIIGGKTLSVTANINFINGSASNVGKIYLMQGSDLSISSNKGSICGSANNTTAAPYLYIYGLGEVVDAKGISNQITVDGGTLWGYIGLFGKNGKLFLDSKPDLYCRVEVAYIEAGKNIGGSNVSGFPDCPAPPSDQGGSTYIYSYKLSGYIVG